MITYYGRRKDNSLLEMNDRKYNKKYNSLLEMKDDEMNKEHSNTIGHTYIGS